jgi:ferredoxin
MLGRIVRHAGRHRVHICGPTQMADDVTEMLRAMGVPADQIRSEAFGGSVAPSTAAGAAVGTATFTASGKSTPVYSGETVLQAAACADVSIDHGCCAGACGRCKVRLVSGNVERGNDDLLTPAERVDGYILACQAKPVGGVAVEA